MPRPTIPTKAFLALRDAVEDQMEDQVVVVRPVVPVYDPTTGRAIGTSSADAGYSGKAHIHPSTGGGRIDIGMGLTSIMTIEVSIPYSADPVPRIDDHVSVLGISPHGDPHLVGETFRIIDVSTGGIAPITRTLTCVFADATPFNPTA